MSELSRNCMRTWREVLPGYSITIWDETTLDRAISYVDQAYRSRQYAFVADYVRLSVLYHQGGIYLDTDVEVLKSFDELLHNQLFFGLQAPGSVGAGVIGSVKGHPFLKLALDKLDAEARAGELTFQPLPELLTALVRSSSGEKPVLLPEDCFYPYNPYSPLPLRQKPLQSNMSDSTVCIHHWEGTWLGTMSLRSMVKSRMTELLRKVFFTRRNRTSIGDHRSSGVG